jgi:hypothetical protein
VKQGGKELASRIQENCIVSAFVQAVDDPLGVGGVERVSDLDRQAEQNFGLDGLAADAMLVRDAVEKFHDQEWMAVFLPDFMNGADIGMVESGSRLCLPLEARQSLSVFDNLIGQKLQALQIGGESDPRLCKLRPCRLRPASRRCGNAIWFVRSIWLIAGDDATRSGRFILRAQPRSVNAQSGWIELRGVSTNRVSGVEVSGESPWG